MGWFFITVACLAGLGLLRMTKAGQQNKKYLDAGRDEQPLQLDHLSAQMRRFVADTRLLRISLESSVRTIAQFINGDLEATNDDRDGFDQMLMNATRNVADWLGVVDRLGEAEVGRIVDGGGNPGAIRSAMEHEGWSFERRNLTMAGRPPMNLRLQAVMEELHKVELAMQQTNRIYR
ncbi:MAG: hypothetical protein AAF721_03950 [Myxococcota bacterium]